MPNTCVSTTPSFPPGLPLVVEPTRHHDPPPSDSVADRPVVPAARIADRAGEAPTHGHTALPERSGTPGARDLQEPPAPAEPAADRALLGIRGTLLRSALLVVLHAAAGRAMTVQELCDELARRGLRPRGRPGKTVSDALRTETGRGRVFQVDRGRYRIGQVPRTTRWRCEQRVAAALAGAAPPQHVL